VVQHLAAESARGLLAVVAVLVGERVLERAEGEGAVDVSWNEHIVEADGALDASEPFDVARELRDGAEALFVEEVALARDHGDEHDGVVRAPTRLVLVEQREACLIAAEEGARGEVDLQERGAAADERAQEREAASGDELVPQDEPREQPEPGGDNRAHVFALKLTPARFLGTATCLSPHGLSPHARSRLLGGQGRRRNVLGGGGRKRPLEKAACPCY